MNTGDIERMLRADGRTASIFKGVHSMDSIARQRFRADDEAVYVFNSKPRASPGEHWMALGTRDGCAYYFDSFGRHPAVYAPLARRLAQTFPVVYWNRHAFQSLTTTACGDYCLAFAFAFARRRTLQQFVDWLDGLAATPDARDHLLRAATVAEFGERALSSYRSFRPGLRGRQRLHVARMSRLFGDDC